MNGNKDQIRESLQGIIHVMNRRDIEAPPSVHVEIEQHCQEIWKEISDESVDEIYPEYDR